jgi:type IV pilus assembly protein PilY1
MNTQPATSSHSPSLSRRALLAALAEAVLLGYGTNAVANPPAPVPISNLPMTIATPAHPQVVFAVANSQSMDGNLSGAIMTGSGMLGLQYSPPGTYQQLVNSSSPQSYTIPTGFTPPINQGPGDGTAPYTTHCPNDGNLCDNSASRLNVAKQGITGVLNTYMQSGDFALYDYHTGSIGLYDTWVYYMSPSTGPFTFTNTPGTNRVVNNPCYNYQSISGSVVTSCQWLENFYSSSTPDVNSAQYMVIGASSDDPSINDVLYAPPGYAWPVCITYGGTHPATPYPPNYSLWDYETGGVVAWYYDAGGGCGGVTGTTPTNAGYVPYSPQSMYALRGFGFYTTQSATDATQLVPMTSAGATPTQTTITTALNTFVPYLKPETRYTGTPEIHALAVQSPIYGLLTGVQNYLATNPPSSNGCTPQQFVVLVTDGLPTLDQYNHAWPPLGAASAQNPPNGYGVSATFNADGSLNSTNDQALTDAITALGNLKSAGVKTYVLGLGAGVDPTLNPTAAATMQAMGVAAGTAATSGPNGYFAADSEQDVINDMQVILAQILAQTQATSSAAVNSTGLRTGTVVYQSQFVTSDVDLDWTGELLAFPVNAQNGQVNTTLSNALWSAKTQLAAQDWSSGRVIATWDPSLNAGAGGGTPFRWNPALAPSGISTGTALATPLATFTPDTNAHDVLHYLRGDSALEQRNGGTFRNRTWVLGDIVDSAPLYVGPPANSSSDPTYVAFEATYANRPPVIYVGANDGMLHAFDATTGDERFAFIPHGVWSNLVNLVNPYYNEQHRFYINGSPQATDVKFANNSWHTVLVSNESQGGNSLFALDVSNPAGLNTESALSAAVLWEFTDADMGNSFSTPSIVNTNAGWLAIFGNGYDSPNGIPVLYAVNIQTGALVEKIKLCNAEAGMCNAAVTNGLSSVTVVNSSGQLTQPNNLVYAGDLQGNMWRIDISNVNPAQWAASVLFQARDPSGNPQPITTAPAVTLNPRYPGLQGTMVFVGTGQLLGAGDLSNTQIQSFYGVYDPPAGYASPIERAGLVAQTLSNSTFTTVNNTQLPVRYVTANAVALPQQNGWYVDLNLTDGERSITTPLVEAGGDVVYTTYYPNASFCTGGGQSWLMDLNYANGSSFSSPQLDVYGSGVISSADTASSGPFQGQNAVGMFLGDVYAASPVVISGGSSSTAPRHKLMSESNTDLQSVGEAGPPHQRISWWEVR